MWNTLWEEMKKKVDLCADSFLFIVISYSFILNPIFLGMQLMHLIDSKDASGLSLIMIAGFIYLNFVTSIVAIKANNKPMFIAFVLSCAISTLIALTAILLK